MTSGDPPREPDTVSIGEVAGRGPAPAPPDRVGPYRIVSRLGEGGFGVVYLAEQDAPIRRRVALKLIKPGMDSAQVIARFEAERQALAVMDHPCVARVLDGGVGPGGLPYFAMELVKGDPITRFCDAHRLPIRARLELFTRVCEAVQHAHMKGVIHRDLKPSNVLVAYDGDGAPQPKVIDFGVAKALNQRLTERTIFTEHGQLIGTPEYMSPEQAEMSGVDIDTRSDVYALGVVLYELLTGVLPFDGAALRRAGYAEVQRIIREVDPPKPSTRLASAGDGGDVVKARRADRRTLTGVLRRDLDWVVMKCLEKDRGRRYRTAHELAEELRRHLRDEPVLAGPPGLVYRTRKFVRRNRAGVVSAAVIAGAIGAGVVSTVALSLRASRAAARQAEIDRFFLGSVFGAVDPNTMKARDVTVRAMLDRAAAAVDVGSPDLEAAVRARIGELYMVIGDFEAARAQFARGRQLPVSPREEARLLIGEAGCCRLLPEDACTASASELLAQVDAGALGGGEQRGLLLRYRIELAYGLMARLRVAEARRLLERSVFGVDWPEEVRASADYATALYAYGNALKLDGDAAGGLRWALRGLEARERLFEAPDTRIAASLNQVGSLHLRLGELERARGRIEAALAQRAALLPPDHASLGQSYSTLAAVLQAEGRLDEAREQLLRAVEVYASPNQPERFLGLIRRRLAVLERARRDLPAAEAAARGAVAAFEAHRARTREPHPDETSSRNELARVLMLRGRLDECAAVLREAQHLSPATPDFAGVRAETSSLLDELEARGRAGP